MKKENPLEIDIYNLHEEARKQAKLYKRWSDRLANATKRTGEAKSAMELVYAELMLKINRKPGKYGLDKTTGPILEAAITVHSTYQEAVQNFHNAKHEADTLKGMVEACSERKDMIQEEIKLFLAGYFAEPRTKGGRDEIDKRSARKKGLRHDRK